MFRKTAFCVLCLLTALLAGCVTPIEQHQAFQPKLEETGGPKALYSIRSEQLPGLFPLGSTFEQISLRFGKPQLSGTEAEANGGQKTWAVYTYGRSYTHVDTNFHVIAVNRFTSATLSFDATGKLRGHSLSRYQKYASGSINRDASEDEVARYLGAPVPIDIKVDAPASAASAAATGKTTTATTGWKLGAEISELRSEQIARTGYKGRGVYVVSIDAQGMAARAGLAAGDVIVKVNGAATPTREDLIDELKAAPLSSNLQLQVFRQGRLRTLTIPAQQPADEVTAI